MYLPICVVYLLDIPTYKFQQQNKFGNAHVITKWKVEDATTMKYFKKEFLYIYRINYVDKYYLVSTKAILLITLLFSTKAKTIILNFFLSIVSIEINKVLYNAAASIIM